jgi:hypothetical protein
MNAANLITAEKRQLKNALTVADLIDALEGMPRDARVLFTCDYGDHAHTTQALSVTEAREMEETEFLARSSYSKSGVALDNLENGDADADDFLGDAYEAAGVERPSVVILN